MTMDIFANKGVALDEQKFTWRELGGVPYCKLDDDAFTRVRVILMNGIESEQNRFLHALARMNSDLQLPAARVRRIEQHQQTLVNWLNPADQSPLDTTIGFEQVAIEVTAAVALAEPDPYLAQVYRFGLLEDFDHMHRYSALMDRLEGRDANDLLQGYTDVMPGRPTSVEHRAPVDDLRRPYDRRTADVLTKLHALTIMAGENQTHDYYMTIGPMFADPLARQLYAEIASIEEQHVTQYESIIDPRETWLEKWLMHELGEVYNYWSCHESEGNPRVKKVWERFLDYELGQLHFVMDLMKQHEGRDPAELLPQTLVEPITYQSHREFVRATLAAEVAFTAVGPEIGPQSDSDETVAYRKQLNAAGSPSDTVAAGWTWRPGGELSNVVIRDEDAAQ